MKQQKGNNITNCSWIQCKFIRKHIPTYKTDFTKDGLSQQENIQSAFSIPVKEKGTFSEPRNDDIGHLRTGKEYRGLINIILCSITPMEGSEYSANSKNLWSHLPNENFLSWWRWNYGVGKVFWSTLGTLISVDTNLNSTAYFNIVADHVHTFMAIMFP